MQKCKHDFFAFHFLFFDPKVPLFLTERNEALLHFSFQTLAPIIVKMLLVVQLFFPLYDAASGCKRILKILENMNDFNAHFLSMHGGSSLKVEMFDFFQEDVLA